MKKTTKNSTHCNLSSQKFSSPFLAISVVVSTTDFHAISSWFFSWQVTKLINLGWPAQGYKFQIYKFQKIVFLGHRIIIYKLLITKSISECQGVIFRPTLYFEANTNFDLEVCIFFEYKLLATNFYFRVWLMYWNVLEYNRIPIHTNLSTQQWKMTASCRSTVICKQIN